MIGKIFRFKDGYGTSPEYVGTYVIILSTHGNRATYRYLVMCNYPNNLEHNIETRNIECVEEVI